MNKKKKAFRINVRDIVYAKLLSDIEGQVEYGPVKSFAGAMQVQVTPSTASGVHYEDGAKAASLTKLTGLTTVLDVGKIPIEVRAEVLGNKYSGGELSLNPYDKAPYIAVGYKVDHDDEDTHEYIWLLKGKAQPYASTIEQTTDNINFSTDTITIDFIPRDSDKEIQRMLDSSGDGYSPEKSKTFFSAVPTEPIGTEEP